MEIGVTVYLELGRARPGNGVGRLGPRYSSQLKVLSAMPIRTRLRFTHSLLTSG